MNLETVQDSRKLLYFLYTLW